MESSESDKSKTATPKPALVPYPRGYEYLHDLAVNRCGWSIPIPAGIDKYNLTYLTANSLTLTETWQWGAKDIMESGIMPWMTPFSSTVKER
jgi:hypothetical protein